jgi:hypothetical protein
LTQALDQEILADLVLASDLERWDKAFRPTKFELPLKEIKADDESLQLISMFLRNDDISREQLARLAYRYRVGHYATIQKLIAADLVAEGCFDDSHPQRPRTVIDSTWWNRPGLVDLSDDSLSPLDLNLPFAGPGQISFKKFSDIRVFSPAELRELIQQSQRETMPTDVPKHKGGRPCKYDWDSFENQVQLRLLQNGFPKTQAILVRDMLEWCQTNWGEEPFVSSAKPHVSKVWHLLKGRAVIN